MHKTKCTYEGGLKVRDGNCDINWILNKNTEFDYINWCSSKVSYQEAVIFCEERIPDEIKDIITVVS